MPKQFYLYETHCHTSAASRCARATPEEMVAGYLERGYSGIIVTDHFFNGNCVVPHDLPWGERVDLYCRSYELAKAAGDKDGLDVFFGFEFTNRGSDFLTYGLDGEWIKAHPEIMEMPIWDYLDLVHKDGGFVTHAHPFREAPYIPEMQLLPYRVDAVEIFNGGQPDLFNKRARWYAESYDLPVSGGSDAHAPDGIRTGILSETKFASLSDLLQAIKERKVQVYEKYSQK